MKTTDLVIGLGNPIMGDDGLGLAALDLLRSRWSLGERITLVDGGTWGMNLLHLIEEAGRVLFLDAINADEPPGTPVVLTGDELPRFFAHKLSPHQIDLKEVLAMAEWRGTLPVEIVAMGLQPEIIEMSTELSDAVAANLPQLVETAARQVEMWGHPVSEKAPAHA